MMCMKTYVVDTYAWVSYFDGKKDWQQWIEQNILQTPSIVLAELSRITLRRKTPESERKKILEYVVKNSLLLPLMTESAIRAGEIAASENLSLADAIIYSYVTPEKQLLTGDEHFRNKDNVILIK